MSRMGPQDHNVLTTFARLAGADRTTRATVNDVAAILGVSGNTVQRSVRRLVIGGFLTRERTEGRGNSQLTEVTR